LPKSLFPFGSYRSTSFLVHMFCIISRCLTGHFLLSEFFYGIERFATRICSLGFSFCLDSVTPFTDLKHFISAACIAFISCFFIVEVFLPCSSVCRPTAITF
jgi:hypothetical protein